MRRAPATPEYWRGLPHVNSRHQFSNFQLATCDAPAAKHPLQQSGVVTAGVRREYRGTSLI